MVREGGGKRSNLMTECVRAQNDLDVQTRCKLIELR
jgi:hypothetical protein